MNQGLSMGSILRSQAPSAIISIAAVTTVVGLVSWLHWYATGDVGGVATFFRYVDPFFTMLFTGAEVGFCLYARSQFVKGDRLRFSWTLLSLSAVAHYIGRLLTTFAAGGLANSAIQETGQVIGGPVQMALLLWGLTQVAGCFRRLAVYRHLRPVDFVMFTIVGALTVRTLFGIRQSLSSAGTAVDWARAALWVSDPLLLMLLVVAVFLWRSVSSLGHGLLANCWRSYVVAIVLTSVGDASLWCGSCTTYPAWYSLGWYVWLIADAAFALGPAFQAAAIERVQAGSSTLRQIALAR